MPTLTIDGRPITVAKGRTVLQATIEAGISVPYYCYHPGISIDGSCRMCQVEIEGVPKLQIACNTPVADGMSIRTKGERVEQARPVVVQPSARGAPQQHRQVLLAEIAVECVADLERPLGLLRVVEQLLQGSQRPPQLGPVSTVGGL